MPNRLLTIEIARVTEAAALAAARLRGRGDERLADEAAVEAMRGALNSIAEIDGHVVIGEGGAGEAPKLFIGERVGGGGATRIDIALKALEGATLCAKALPNSMSCMAVAEAGKLLHAPDTYMDKVAIGGGYPADTVALDRPPGENIQRLAKAKGVDSRAITACILDRPRHAGLIAQVREAGAAIRLISDGDVAGVIHAAQTEETGIDIYLGIGGAPEGVLAAAALRCIGGQMQGRLVPRTIGSRERAASAAPPVVGRIYGLDEMASGNVMFAATGVTSGSLLEGVVFRPGWIETETIVMRSASGTLRWIRNRMRL